MTSSTAQPTVALPGGVAMPLLGFGTWQATGHKAEQAVVVALEAGYRHIDTATAYGNESQIGRAIGESGVPREDIFITTKLPAERATRARQVLEASMSALGTDYLDLWLIHWPPRGDRLVPAWRELIAARDAGLVRSIGVSNYSLGQIDDLIEQTSEAPAVNQIRWGPVLFEPAVVRGLRERRVVLEGYSPFKTTRLNDPVLRRIGEAHGVTPPQVIVRWHIQHGFVVIPKSVTPERIRVNGDVFGFELSSDQVREIDAMAR